MLAVGFPCYEPHVLAMPVVPQDHRPHPRPYLILILSLSYPYPIPCPRIIVLAHASFINTPASLARALTSALSPVASGKGHALSRRAGGVDSPHYMGVGSGEGSGEGIEDASGGGA